MKVLNLYAGVGGNRKNWTDVDVTSVENYAPLAAVYRRLYPEDTLIEGDAHKFLLDHYDEFDFIWSSPPCQTHSRMSKATRHNLRRYTDLSLYEEIMLLRDKFEGGWVVENVRPYYAPLIEPAFSAGRHLFWANFKAELQDVPRPADFINLANLAGKKKLMDWLGIRFEENIYYKGNHCPAQVLRNCVHPEIGRQVFDAWRYGQSVAPVADAEDLLSLMTAQ